MGSIPVIGTLHSKKFGLAKLKVSRTDLVMDIMLHTLCHTGQRGYVVKIDYFLNKK